jgi:hypothetical protein
MNEIKMTEISIYANIIKPIDELENEIFFALSQTQLKDFITSLDEKVGSVDFSVSLIRQINNNLVDYYEKYNIEEIEDKSFKNEYELLKEVKTKLDTFRKN